MSPSSHPGNPRVVRPWLAAALMLAVWLAATPARCDPGPGAGPGAARLAASTLAATTLAGPAWHWLQQAWAELQSWGSGGAREEEGSRPATRQTAGGWQDAGNAGSAAPEGGSTGGGSSVTGTGSGSDSTGGSDPNG